MTSPSFDAILMASGFSRRFGNENKLLLPFAGQPLALYTLRLVCGMPQFGRVFFVCAHPSVAALANGYPLTILHNAHPQLGQRESIRLGTMASSANFYVFFTCDQPLLNEATVNAVLARSAPGKITFPRHAGSPASPASFSSTFRAELLSLHEGQHARDIKKAHPHALVPVDIDDALPLMDADTPEALELLHSLAEERASSSS